MSCYSTILDPPWECCLDSQSHFSRLVCSVDLFLLDSVGGGLYVSRKLSVSSRLSNLLSHNCSSHSLMVFYVCISAVSIEISPFSFLTLFIWVLSLFFWVNVARNFSSLLTLSKNQLLVFTDFPP